jgi:type VI secretion system secreted protein VgrG
MTSGHKFTLERHFNADGPYLLTSVAHACHDSDHYRSGGGSPFTYQNSFTCTPLGLPFRPPRKTPKPLVPGTQTAVVVGPKGQEVFTDKYGRVKVQFHWDRHGRHNEHSSCWVRVAQPWAGKRWGTSFWPRVGQEVIVDFLEGDPDQPIIIGSVYNAEQMPPYLGHGLDGKHPHDNQISGIKTNSTPGGKGYNELRFNDAKGKEQVFVHAERDLDVRVKNESRERVYGNRHQVVGWEKDGKKGGDRRERIYQDQHVHVHRDRVEHVEGNVQLLVGKGEAESGGQVDIVIEKDKKERIEGDQHVTVKGARRDKVDGDQALTVGGSQKECIRGNHHLQVKSDRMEKVSGAQSLTVGGNQQEKVGRNHALEAGQEIHLKAGMKVILEAGVQLTIKGPGGFVDIGPAGVTIQGTMVLINTGGAAGTGSGSNPASPESPEAPEDAQEAKPRTPALADDSTSGVKSAPG